MILGPTASGKTVLACQLAHAFNGEIISADSRQVYRQMDIGTGKDLEEYQVEGEPIPYHLIDIKDPGYKYNIAEYQIDFLHAFDTITKQGNMPIMCGGSGLYIETALKGNSYLGIPTNEQLWQRLKPLSDEALEEEYLTIDPKIKGTLNALTRPRKIRAIEVDQFLKSNPDWKALEIPAFRPLIIGVNIERDLRREKITKRLSYRMNNGLIEEVENLLLGGLSHDDLAYYGLEYKWVGAYLKKEFSKRELFENLNIAIHQFAKRQMTWFRRMEKNGYHINWIDAQLPLDKKVELVKSWL